MKKRVFAYLIDIFIVMGILFLIKSIMPNNSYNFNDLNEQFIQKEISFVEYFNEYAIINQNMVKKDLGLNIISLVITIIYFVLIPYFNNGSTIGKKLFKLKIKRIDDKKLELDDIIARSVLVDGIGYLLFIIILVYILPSNLYFWYENILGFAQIIVVIISGFMVLYRKDHLGLHDILTKTIVKEID